MNVFEDLVTELKEENLLEEIFFDLPSANGNGQPYSAAFSSVASANGPSLDNGSGTTSEALQARLSQQIAAMELVELVLSAVANANGQRTLPYDVLSVKKSFHRYSRAVSDPETEDFFEAESDVLASIESWQHDLALRDEKIPTAAFRKYVESANPPLSPHALFALVRFYRSLPVSNITLGKFDFVVTRLFSKFVDGERRKMLCPQSEAVKYLTQRYSDWSVDNFRSIPADDPEIAVPVSRFGVLAAEAESAGSFAELVKSNFFQRLSELKSATGATMFVPKVIAAAVEANLHIATRMIELLGKERDRHGEGLGSRLASVDFSLISDAVARTFEVNNSNEINDPASADSGARAAGDVEKIKVGDPSRPNRRRSRANAGGKSSAIFGVNRWLLLATVLTVVVSLGVYVWADRFADEPAKPDTVRVIDLEKPELKRFVTATKLSGTMLYAVVTPAFEEMSVDVQRDYLKSLYQFGGQKGYARVTLMNSRGRNIGYADAERLEMGTR